MPRVIIIAESLARGAHAATAETVAAALDRFFGEPTDAPVYWNEEGTEEASRADIESTLTDPNQRAVIFYDDDGQKVSMALE